MTTHWTSWKEAVNACANVGKATLAMLVSSEESSMESDRLTSAHRTEDAPSAFPDTVTSGFAMIAFTVSPLFQANAETTLKL